MIVEGTGWGFACINCRQRVRGDGTVRHGKPRCSEVCKICNEPCNNRGRIAHSKGCYSVSADGGGESPCYGDHGSIEAEALANGCVEGAVSTAPEWAWPRRLL